MFYLFSCVFSELRCDGLPQPPLISISPSCTTITLLSEYDSGPHPTYVLILPEVQINTLLMGYLTIQSFM